MNVVVCIKQVPDTTNVRINPETNTLMREGVESIVNPFDEYALEQGLLLKDRCGAKLIVVVQTSNARAIGDWADAADAILTDYASEKDFRFRYDGDACLTIYAYVEDGLLYCEVLED